MDSLESSNTSPSMDATPSKSSAPARVLERMKQRQDNLAQQTEQRRLEKESKAASSESIDYFQQTFLQKRNALEGKLEEAGNVAKSELSDFIDTLVKDVQDMQQMLNESSLFLASFQLKIAQEELNALNARVTAKIEQLQPKKKFGFGRKQQTSKENEKAKVLKKDETDNSKETAGTSTPGTLDHLLENRQFFGFKDETGKTLTMAPGELENRQLNLHNLRDCRVVALGNPSTIQAASLHNCTVIMGPISRSVFVKDSSDSKFIMACQQVRIHNTSRTCFYIHVTSSAIIENCLEIQFAPYNLQYPKLDQHYLQSGLDRATNRWNKIEDFHWLNEKEDSPNWSIIPEADRTSDWLK
ncbi:hypothetical protein Pmani_011851 [Petrolisthes manimaculis]|uniref:C-CAP/cofactor C-like domain-containing protein n=1 Tax=Petrolisthes manimaculis TaxID=1843537 RepID=A0AAE1Q0B3_9EUCA|nr:hypothetical protein Pmani_011851 [Petrolisthes manimaculis]